MTRKNGLFRPVDMTVGEPWKQIVIFMIPLLIGNVVQQLYNTVDSIVVGRFLGDDALAAVGSAGPIVNLLIVLFVGIGMGASIMVAQYLGAGDREGVSRSVGNCVVMIVIAAALVTGIGLLIARPLLTALNTPAVLIDNCALYLRILLSGSIGLGFYNILCGVLRGMGDSISALIYLIIASVLNIILDVLFVAGFGMGVEGAALATIIAQGLSAVLCVLKLIRMKDVFDFDRKYLRIERDYTGGILRLGVPSGVTQVILSMSMILVQALNNRFGATFIAASVICSRIDAFAMMPAMSFGNAMTTYAGQNMGAGNICRTEEGAKQGIILAVATSGAIGALLCVLGRPLASIFTDTEEIVVMSQRFIRILSLGYMGLAGVHCMAGVMRGAGETLVPMWLSIIQLFGMRVPLAYLLCYLTRSPELPYGVKEMTYVSLLMSFVLGCLMHWLVYRQGKWKAKVVAGRNQRATAVGLSEEQTEISPEPTEVFRE